MPMRTIASFAVAIFLGLIAVVLVRNYIGARTAPGVTAGGGVVLTRPVVVAAGPIARGAPLQATMLKLAAYPADAVPAGSFDTVAAAMGAAGQSRIALRTIAINEPLLSDKISGAGGKANLSANLSPGMRAVSIRSTDVAGVAGFVMPGDRVDVMLIRPSGAADRGFDMIQSLGENIRVVGVDQSDSVEGDKPVVAKAITVEVTPEQAQAITLAQSVGQVSLSLRQIADDAPLARRATALADLGKYNGELAAAAPVGRQAHTNIQHARATPTGKAPMQQIRVTRGVEVSSYPTVVD